MDTIVCPKCGTTIEISEALHEQVESEIRKEEAERREAALRAQRKELEEEASSKLAVEQERMSRLLAAERERLAKEAQTQQEIELQKIRTRLEVEQRQRTATEEADRIRLQGELDAAAKTRDEYRKELSAMMDELQKARKEKDEADITLKKRLAEEEGKIREQAEQAAQEKQRLELASRDKTIADLKSALEDAQRKASQGSQQLQGEILELDLEEILRTAFREDDILPVPKGVRGADILHVVKGLTGVEYGRLLWELKRTRNWSDGWIPKLKEDLRDAGAQIAVLISEVLPKGADTDIVQVQGVWCAKPNFALVLAQLLRKGIIDAGQQKSLAVDRGSKADALFAYVTSHAFAQQVESMVETYQEMITQINRERAQLTKAWALREAQAQRLLGSTATIVGGMQAYVGQAAMPRIEGLDVLEIAEPDTRQ
ncbi:MAG: DUF2130 domain-containing protein [Candidatus Dormibacteria bacterium]